MSFFRSGPQEERSEPEGLGVDALKDLWGIEDNKRAYEPVTAPVSTDIYSVPSAFHGVPRRRSGRH